VVYPVLSTYVFIVCIELAPQTLTALGRISDSLLKNSAYGQAIAKSIENIHKCRARFQAEAQKFQHYRLHAMDQTALETQALAHDTSRVMADLRGSITEQRERDEIWRKNMSRKMNDATSAINSTKEVLGDVLKNAECK
jgi:uncharacterized protein YhaN